MKAFLTQISLFKNLQKEDYSLLVSDATSKKYKKDSIIFEEGDEAEHLYLVEKGKVKLFRTRKGSEKEEIVCLILPSGFFCLAPLLNQRQFHISAKALEETEMILLKKQSILKLMNESHDFAKNIIQVLAGKECDLCEEVCNLSLATTKERLAKYLLDEYKRNDRKSFSLPVNQSQLASFLGTVRETLSRDLAGLKKARIIVIKDHRVKIVEPKELTSIASGFEKGLPTLS